jgi:hypothetical protein
VTTEGPDLQSLVGGMLAKAHDARPDVDVGRDLDRTQLKELWPEIQRGLLVSEQLLGVYRVGETGYLAVTTERMLVLSWSINRGGELRGTIAFDEIANASIGKGANKKLWNLTLTMRDGSTNTLNSLRERDRETLKPYILIGRALTIAERTRAVA